MSDPRIEDFATQLSIRDNAIAQLAMTNVCNNAYVRYVAAVFPIDESTMEIEHGALELFSAFEFPLNSQETQSRELYISPSQKKYYTQQPGRFFLWLLKFFWLAPLAHVLMRLVQWTCLRGTSVLCPFKIQTQATKIGLASCRLKRKQRKPR